jgi:ankyrin repeat protein
MANALRKGADINYASSSGKTSLHYASAKGSSDAARLLLNNGALERQDKNGDTPLHAAAKNGHVQTCKLLLERGADSFFRNVRHQCSLLLAWS